MAALFNASLALSDRVKTAIDSRDSSLEPLGSLHEQLPFVSTDVLDIPQTCGFLSQDELEIAE